MRPKNAFILAALLFVQTAAADTLTRIRIDAVDAPPIAARLQSENYDVLDATIAPHSFEVVATTDELLQLQQQGLSYAVLEQGRPFRQILFERHALEASITSGYQDLTGVLDTMAVAASTYPSICQLVDLTTTYGVSPTVEGNHIYAVKISDNVTQDEAEPAMLIVGAHHCREVVSTVIALHAIDQLTTQYSAEAPIAGLVNEYEIWIAPVWNPDGYEYVFDTDNLWRKNRNNFPGGVGADLNRNYPFGWDALCGGSNIVTAANYRGPGPASEAETQTMIAFADDRHFTKVADLHSFAQEVRYGTGCLSHPYTAFMAAEAADLAASMFGYNAASSCCTAGDIHHHFANHGSYAFLWETHTSFQPDYVDAQGEAQLVFPSIIAMLQRPIPLKGRVTDAISGEPVAATVTLAGVTFQNGETNGSDARLGRYHVFAPAGPYVVEFAAPGYLPESHPVTMTSAGATVLDIALERADSADFDGDGDVDLSDFSQFLLCFGGANNAPAGSCPPGVDADFDDDGDVDLSDFSQFSLRFTGPA